MEQLLGLFLLVDVYALNVGSNPMGRECPLEEGGLCESLTSLALHPFPQEPSLSPLQEVVPKVKCPC